jgi:uncharacterized protein YjeT (DUF2065 family)
MGANAFWSALGLFLVIEGVLPFLSPGAWRRGMNRLMQLRDGQLRFIGLGTVLTGLVLIWIAG